MEIEENPNPNSHDTSKSWSELPLDLSSSILERLRFADFQQAKSVCSSWHSASKQSVPKNQIHWLILFPEHNKNNDSRCTLFNPEEKDNKLYKTKDLGFEEFAKSVCIATYGSCLLMQDPCYNLYIVNLFNQHERMIHLPPMELGRIQSPVFWIDEKTKDYVVLYGRFSRRGRLDVLYCFKKGDDNVNLLWKQIPETSNCINLVYKDHKLYFLSSYGVFKIFDFSSFGYENPKQTFQCGVKVDRFVEDPAQHQLSNRVCFATTKIVVNVTGQVFFKVEKFSGPRTWSFRVFKFYSSGFLKIPEMVDSLGDEAMLFDQGITVVASEEGFVRNSIYFSDRHNDIFIFNLETKKTELLHKFDFSSVQFSRARWFLPSFTHT